MAAILRALKKKKTGYVKQGAIHFWQGPVLTLASMQGGPLWIVSQSRSALAGSLDCLHAIGAPKAAKKAQRRSPLESAEGVGGKPRRLT